MVGIRESFRLGRLGLCSLVSFYRDREWCFFPHAHVTSLPWKKRITGILGGIRTRSQASIMHYGLTGKFEPLESENAVPRSTKNGWYFVVFFSYDGSREKWVYSKFVGFPSSKKKTPGDSAAVTFLGWLSLRDPNSKVGVSVTPKDREIKVGHGGKITMACGFLVAKKVGDFGRWCVSGASYYCNHCCHKALISNRLQ